MKQTTPLTENEQLFIKENYLKMSKGKIAKTLGVKFSTVLSFCNSKKIKAPPEKIKEFIKRAHAERIEREKKGIHRQLDFPFWKHNWNPITGLSNATY